MDKNSMQILIATPLYPPDVGGPATYTAEIEKRLPKHGISVSVLPFGRFLRYPYIIRHIAYFFALLRQSGRVDAVFAQDPLGVGLPAVIAARLRRKKAFVRIAGDRAWETGVQKFGTTEPLEIFAGHFTKNPIIWILKIAHAIVTPSNYMKDVVISWGVPRDKVHTIYNGLDLSAVPHCASKHTFDKTLISAGRLVPWKGFSALIEMMQDMPDWRLLIAGDGPEKENLKKQVASNNLQDRVLFLGALDRDTLFKNLCQADAFVLNTRYEGLSHMLMEVMEAGVPIVTTRIGGNPELIVHKEHGLLVEPDNVADIKEALTHIEENADMRAQMISAARSKAEAFSIESTVTQLKELLKTI